MRLLLDTHAFLWWLDGDRRLSTKVRTLVAAADTEVLVSAASAWEITTKFRLGKLPAAVDVAADVRGALLSQGFVELPMSVSHAARAGALSAPDRDPFDRVLAAQSILTGVPIASIDDAFDRLGATRIW